MKITKNFILLLTILSALMSACGKKTEDKASNPLAPSQKTDGTTRIISRSMCDGEPTDRGSIVRSPWLDKRISSKNVVIDDTYVFKADKLTKTTVCSLGESSIKTSVDAEIGLSEKVNEFVIIKGAKNTVYLKLKDTDFPCTSEVATHTEAIKYQFKGDCLYLNPGDDGVDYPPGQY